MSIKISDTRDYFLKDGKKFFYLADTCWSAFTNISYEEWRYYLDYRKMQGFNAIQMNILPQWDRSESDCYIDPFEVLHDGGWNFTRRNEKYFNRVEEMLEMAIERDFTPALVVLWCNYVKGTWGSRIDPSKVIPRDTLESYVSYVVERYKRFDPIFIVSGDTNFETDEAKDYYMSALKIIKRFSPDSLTTMHLCGGFWEIPKEFIETDLLDFYMYQSGHNRENQHLAYELAQRFYSMPVKRPIVNGEPCYEGHGYGYRFGRFNNFDVRKAIWQSLLSGAKAGVTYGAHGIWSWHKKGKRFKSEDFSRTPFDRYTALRFPGAFNTSFARWIFERYDLFEIEPRNELLLEDTQEIRVSEDKDRIVIYIPYSWNIRLNIDANLYDWEAIELETRRVFKPEVKRLEEYSLISMSDFNTDYIIIGIKS